MVDKPIPGSYIDTQGMGAPLSPEERAKLKNNKPVKHLPMEITPHRLHTPQLVKELKILIHEVMDEREGKMDYDSYFDTDKFKYRVGEEEPPYKP